MVDVESPQRPGDTSIPNLVNDPMHDEHAEIGLGHGPNTHHVHEQVVECIGKGCDPIDQVEAFAIARHDHDKVIH